MYMNFFLAEGQKSDILDPTLRKRKNSPSPSEAVMVTPTHANGLAVPTDDREYRTVNHDVVAVGNSLSSINSILGAPENLARTINTVPNANTDSVDITEITATITYLSFPFCIESNYIANPEIRIFDGHIIPGDDAPNTKSASDIYASVRQLAYTGYHPTKGLYAVYYPNYNPGKQN
ncbi:unnamed protein product [Allacma fusca]|uniref:Uncharacterized protein n=1 Tax=Allacma fusca TaxID=39272 RepID=A0A8J2KZU5_9HEXA|nr:unnamed protein product [Allacma fusca]